MNISMGSNENIIQRFSGGNVNEVTDISSIAKIKSVSLRDLLPGQLFEGEVEDINKDVVKILLDGGKQISARMQESVNLNIGDKVTFQVKENNDSQVVIRPYKLDDESPVIEKALNGSGLAVNSKNVSVIKDLMEQGQPLNKQNILDTLKMVNKYPSANISDIITLNKHGITVNEDNLEMYQAYQEGNGKIVDMLGAITDDITDLLENVVKSNNASDSFNIVSDVLDSLVQDKSPFDYNDNVTQINTDEQAFINEKPLDEGVQKEFIDLNLIKQENGEIEENNIAKPEIDEKSLRFESVKPEENRITQSENEVKQLNGESVKLEESKFTQFEPEVKQVYEESVKPEENRITQSENEVKQLNGELVKPEESKFIQSEVEVKQANGESLKPEENKFIQPKVEVNVEPIKLEENKFVQSEAGIKQLNGESTRSEENKLTSLESDSKSVNTEQLETKHNEDLQKILDINTPDIKNNHPDSPNQIADRLRELLARKSNDNIIKTEIKIDKPEHNVLKEDFSERNLKSNDFNKELNNILERIHSDNSKDTIKEVKNDIIKLFENADKQKQSEMVSNQTLKKIVNDLVKKSNYISPEKLIMSDNPKKELIRNLNVIKEEIDKLSETVKDCVQKGLVNEKSAENVLNDLKSTSQNFNFMNDLNNVVSYMQIPLKFTNQEAEGELYVYNKNKSKTVEDGISAFLHFDLESLGATDIRLKLKNTGLNMTFELADSESVKLVDSHIDELADKLTKKGYMVNYSVKEIQKEEHNSLEEIFSKDNTRVQIKRYSFDMRT